MDNQIIVQNVKKYCDRKGIKPTRACKDAGVGSSFINDLERGKTPSVRKVQKLAEYLGVTTSDLLGEEKEKQELDPVRQEMYDIIEKSTDLDRRKFLDMIKMYLGWEQQALEDRKKSSPAKSETAHADKGPFFEVGSTVEPGTYVCVSCEQTYFYIQTPEDKLQVCPRCNSNYFRRITNAFS